MLLGVRVLQGDLVIQLVPCYQWDPFHQGDPEGRNIYVHVYW